MRDFGCGLRKENNCKNKTINNQKFKIMKNLKLNKLNSNKISAEKANAIKGGKMACCCACAFANSGGSSTMGNFHANDHRGLQSPQCKEHACLL